MNYSPLRYPGGKTKLAPHIKSLISKNGLEGCEYVEPYAGGAGVALSLLIDGYVSRIHINDADFAIYSFWKVLVENTDELIDFIKNIDVSIETWHKQKKILASPTEYSFLELGFATFFLNRTNRSGILKGGVIGGKNQDGNYKLDARFNKSNLLFRIENIRKFTDGITVSNDDAADLLIRLKSELTENSIVYLDPPYYIKGQGLYRNYYSHDDHVRIMTILSDMNFRWIVSYDNNDEIKKIYNRYRQHEYTLNYSAQCKSKGKEVIIYSDTLNLS
ncbi:DNA adenine methylase [Xenorhabdus sp. XENO-7]|uniref:site-specific DNA-methyltransferase (adenine-specific) n=1 Tax=Xenorhabdus aichiensis TaxID=3025874 RepID=A0ABT5M404_9GAMM|nr:DNA adenine methylase [Xenorhabdus aichiensis]MDC9622409.1 DNA adenine methylase [Xenorhabdus aichiensis]